MFDQILQKIAQLIYLPKLRKAEKEIGYKFIFHDIPKDFINGWISYDETAIWRKFGLDILRGVNYWTIGKVSKGSSLRYARNAPEYQSWLGAYLVKLGSKQTWTLEDHFKLAIADQNSWLSTEGDPDPMTSLAGWKFQKIEKIKLGNYPGVLYHVGCATHSDLGHKNKKISILLEFIGIAALFNSTNPKLKIKSSTLIPQSSAKHAFEPIDLHGYIAIVDIEDRVKLVMYANGAIVPKKNGNTDTFLLIKDGLLKALESAEIIKL